MGIQESLLPPSPKESIWHMRSHKRGLFPPKPRSLLTPFGGEQNMYSIEGVIDPSIPF